MTYTTCGTCPQCGAPIYTYAQWWSILPPPSLYSCKCKTTERVLEVSLDAEELQKVLLTTPKREVVKTTFDQRVVLEALESVKKNQEDTFKLLVELVHSVRKLHQEFERSTGS